MLATAEQILALSQKLPFKDIPCPELGEGMEVRVQRLDTEEFIALMNNISTDKDAAYAYWIAATCRNGEGGKLFTPEQAKRLAKVDFALVNRLAAEAMAINGAVAGQDAASKK